MVHEQLYSIPSILKVHGGKGQLGIKISRKALRGVIMKDVEKHWNRQSDK